VSGTFEGMRSAATDADLHQSKMTGIRGVMIHELKASKAMAGSMTCHNCRTECNMDVGKTLQSGTD
jgi:hypothetical protein